MEFGGSGIALLPLKDPALIWLTLTIASSKHAKLFELGVCPATPS
jgi:hypothetical protein